MSQQTATATRRAIRKAVGQDALEAMAGLGLTVYQQHKPLLEFHGERLDDHNCQIDLLRERLTRLETQERIRSSWSVWRRLRWVLRGE